jgi:hypothetical protein
MKCLAIFLLVALAACGRQADPKPAQAQAAAGMAAAQSMMPGKAGAEMHMIPIPKDKAQLDRLLAMGYTIHQDHMHPPGVKECPFDKNSGSVVG